MKYLDSWGDTWDDEDFPNGYLLLTKVGVRDVTSDAFNASWEFVEREYGPLKKVFDE